MAFSSGPLDDALRLEELRALGILDAPAARALARLTQLVARLSHSPMAYVSLVHSNLEGEGGRDYLAAAVGLPDPWAHGEASISPALCREVTTTGDPVVIADGRAHPLVRDSLAVSHLRCVAYAAVPLFSHAGKSGGNGGGSSGGGTGDAGTIGMLCLIDSEPRQWSLDDLATVRDIADSMETELELGRARQTLAEMQRTVRQHENRLGALAHGTQEAIVETDDEGRVVFVNRAWAELTGYSPEQSIGRDALGSLPKEASELLRAQANGLREGRSEELRTEACIPSPDGPERWYAVAIRAKRSFSGDWRGIVATMSDISARRLMETQLARSREVYRSMADTMQEATLQIDTSGRLTFLNSAWLRLTGYPTSESLGLPLMGYVHPADRELFLSKQRELWNEAAVIHHQQVRIITASGDVCWVELQGRPLRSPDGRFAGAAASLTDVTRFKRAEEDLRRSEEQYRSLVTNVHEIIFAMNEAGFIDYLNPAWTKVTGFEVDQSLGHRLVEYLHPDDQEASLRSWQEIESGGRDTTHLEMRVVGADGSLRWLDLTARVRRDDKGRFLGAGGAAIDITAQREAQDDLLRSEKAFRSVFENLQDVYYELDLAGIFTRISPSALRLTGHTPDELVGRPISTIYAEPGQMLGLAEVLRQGDRTEDYQAQIVRRDGSRFTASFNVSVARDERGAMTGFHGTFRDISRRVAAERGREEIFKLSPDMLAVCDAHGTFLRVNNAWERQLGYIAEDLVGHAALLFVHEDDVADSWAAIRRSREGEEIAAFRSRFRDAHGRFRWLAWSFSPLTSEGIAYAVARDVSELVQADIEQRELLAAVEANARVLADQAKQVDRLRIEAEYLANHDVLTGVFNRRAWFEEAARARPSAIAICDLDHFKQINDLHGHPAGDLVLSEVTKRMKAALKPSEAHAGEALGSQETAALGRLGGEEFGIIFSGDFRAAEAGCRRIVAAFGEQPIKLVDGSELSVTLSIGLAPYRPGRASREEAIARAYEEADRALYEAKAAGRNRLAVRPAARRRAA